MAASSTLADLYVNVSTNNTGLTSGLNKAKATIVAAGGSIGSAFTAALGPVGALLAGAFAVKECVSSYAEAEVASERLGQAFENAGVDVESSMASFNRAAGEIMKLTTVGDEAVGELYRYGLTLGVPAEGLENTTKAAIGLGRSLNMEPAMVMKALAQETQGYESKLGKLIPGLRGVTDQQERLRIIQEAAANGMADEQAYASTLMGSWEQLKNALGETSESIGGLLAPALRFGAMALTELAGFVQRLVEQFSGLGANTGNIATVFTKAWDFATGAVSGYFTFIADVVATVFGSVIGWIDAFSGWLLDLVAHVSFTGESVGSVFTFIWESIKGAFTAIGNFIAPYVAYIAALIEDVAFAFVNWDLTVKTVGIGLAETWTNIVGRVQWMGENIGVFLSWFGDNFSDIWNTSLDAVLTMLINFGENIRNFFSSLWDFVSSGGTAGFNMQWKSLLDGAQNYVKQMPEFKAFTATTDFDDQKAEVAKEWDARRKAWDSVTREAPVAVDPEAVGLGIGDLDATGKGKGKKDKGKDDKTGSIQSLGSAFKQAQGVNKEAEKQHREAMKKMDENTAATNRGADAMEDLADKFETVD